MSDQPNKGWTGRRLVRLGVEKISSSARGVRSAAHPPKFVVPLAIERFGFRAASGVGVGSGLGLGLGQR